MVGGEFRKSYLQIVRECGPAAAVVFGEVEFRLSKLEFGFEKDGIRWYYTNYNELAAWMGISYEEARGAVRWLKNAGYISTDQAYVHGTRRLLIALGDITNCVENIVTFPGTDGVNFTVSPEADPLNFTVSPGTDGANSTVAPPVSKKEEEQEGLKGQEEERESESCWEDYFWKERTAWKSAKAQLTLQLGEAAALWWIGTTEFYGYCPEHTSASLQTPPLAPPHSDREGNEKGVFVLQVPDQAAFKMMGGQLYRNVRRVLSDCYGQSIEIQFVCKEATSREMVAG